MQAHILGKADSRQKGCNCRHAGDHHAAQYCLHVSSMARIVRDMNYRPWQRSGLESRTASIDVRTPIGRRIRKNRQMFRSECILLGKKNRKSAANRQRRSVRLILPTHCQAIRGQPQPASPQCFVTSSSQGRRKIRLVPHPPGK